MNDDVTGAVAEVELVVDVPIDRVWGLITDVSRIGEWSPECVFAAWRPVLVAEGNGRLASFADLPRVGAWFDARNEYADGFKADVECVVTEAVRPSVFEWVVLDDVQDVDRPGSIWRYELERENRGGTRIRHRFTHGPGVTGLREFIQNHPDRARTALAGRLAELRGNMTATLQAMIDPTGAKR